MNCLDAYKTIYNRTDEFNPYNKILKYHTMRTKNKVIVIQYNILHI